MSKVPPWRKILAERAKLRDSGVDPDRPEISIGSVRAGAGPHARARAKPGRGRSAEPASREDALEAGVPEFLVGKVRLSFGCWIWTGAVLEESGTIERHGKTLRAHRWVWTTMGRRDLSKDEALRAACKRTLCVNPDHRFVSVPVTKGAARQRRAISSPRWGRLYLFGLRGDRERVDPAHWHEGTSRQEMVLCRACMRYTHIWDWKDHSCHSCTKKADARRSFNAKWKAEDVRYQGDSLVGKRCQRCLVLRPLDAFESRKVCKYCLRSGINRVRRNLAWRQLGDEERRYSLWMSSANKSGHSVAISIDEWRNYLSLPCEYCGSRHKVGIDRRKASRGYIPGNCASCCEQCNRRKLQLTDDEWHRVMRPLVDKFGAGRVWPKKDVIGIRGRGRKVQRRELAAIIRLFASMAVFAAAMLDRLPESAAA